MTGRVRRALPGLIAVGLALAIGIGLGVEGARRYPFESLEFLLGRETPLPPGWARFPEGPGARYEATVAVVGSGLYVFGGFVDQQLNAGSDVYRWDRTSKEWRRLADMPGPITHRVAAVVGDTVWMAGGFIGKHPGPTTNEVWAYLAGSDTWVRGPDLPAPRGGGALVALDGELRYFGGYGADRDAHVADHWRLPIADAISGNGAWTPAAPLPAARGHLAGVVMDGSVYAIGGTERHDPAQIDVARVDRYDPSLDRWTSVTPLPRPRSHVEPSTFVHDGRIYVIGGRSRPSYRQQLTDLTVYDPVADRWLAGPPIPEPRMAPIAVALGDTIVVGLGSVDYQDREPTIWFALDRPGWWQGSPMPLALGEVSAAVIGDHLLVVGQGSEYTLGYHLGVGEWENPERFTRRPALGGHHAGEMIGGELYLMGGFGPSAGLTQIFDPAANRWRFGPDIPFRAGGSASSVIDGKIHLVGGIEGDATSQSHVRLDPASARWTRLAPMPRPRHHAAAGTDGRRLYVFGGLGPGSGDRDTVANDFADVQIYDPVTDAWTVSNGGASAPRPLPHARGGMGKAVYLHGVFYVLGGETLDASGTTGGRVYDRVDIYDPVADQWHAGLPMLVPRHGISAVLLGDRIYVAGGGVRAGQSASAALTVLRPGLPAVHHRPDRPIER